MRTWVFSLHAQVPENLVRAIQTALNQLRKITASRSLASAIFQSGTFGCRIDSRPTTVTVRPLLWNHTFLTFSSPISILFLGYGTNCAASHFRNMRLILNSAMSLENLTAFVDAFEPHKVAKGTCIIA
jgi:hypothetical protein